MKKLIALLLVLVACQNQKTVSQYNVQGDNTTNPGWVSVFQTATSESETTINILRPRLARLTYEVDGAGVQKVIKTTTGPHIHWKVDRIHIRGLSPQKIYRLNIRKKRGNKIIDWREFKTLDLKKKKARFVVGSCMSDSYAFEHVRSKIWHRMQSQNPDFILLLGDQVYVDSFDFVKRESANEFDIWTRYIDSFRKIPLFQMRKLVPLFAVWDDHDFGTNNSNKNFKSKEAALKVFTAFFGGVNIPKVFDGNKKGVFFSFDGYGQRFVLMDDRFYREPKDKDYGQWGKKQHQWFKKKVLSSKAPIWIANGGQFFAPATVVTRKDGSKKTVNESFIADHPTHYKTLMKDIKAAQSPVAFLSGDIHMSEIVKIDKSLLGYETYEITSSPIHSFLFRTKPGQRKFLVNPGRVVAHKDHNYIFVESEATEKGLKVKASSYGVKQEAPFFERELTITR